MIYSYAQFGYEGSMVNVEVDIRNGIPAVDIVGLADGSVKAARERVRAAIANSNFDFPAARVLIGLSPADLRKDGNTFDLPIALAILLKQRNIELTEKVMCIGELYLNGEVGNVRGVLAALQTARAAGIKYAVIPHIQNDIKIDGMYIVQVGTLDDAFIKIQTIHEHEPSNSHGKKHEMYFPDASDYGFFNEMNEPRHNAVKMAMVLAAAGGHSMLVQRYAGDGTTSILRSMPCIMPNMDEYTSEQVNRIYDLAGLSEDKKREFPPFRMPHQTVSLEGMCGGGVHCAPGEVSLAHGGVMFLDDAAEFRSSVLQMMRIPLENGKITLARAGRSTVYPCDLQLVMAMNTCPCGNKGYQSNLCVCSDSNIETYWKKISKLLIDRIDITLSANAVADRTVTLADARAMVARARKTQMKRQGKLNSKLDFRSDDFFNLCDYNFDIIEYVDVVSMGKGINDCDIARLCKVAMTYADVMGRGCVTLSDMDIASRFTGINV